MDVEPSGEAVRYSLGLLWEREREVELVPLVPEGSVMWWWCQLWAVGVVWGVPLWLLGVCAHPVCISPGGDRFVWVVGCWGLVVASLWWALVSVSVDDTVGS